jgi:hypothetical protein
MAMKNWIHDAIMEERKNQHSKWGGVHQWGVGDCSSIEVDDSTKVMVLTEECGEVSRAVLELDQQNLKEELIQVAAVAVAWLESLETV